jgi:hypothetical protein
MALAIAGACGPSVDPRDSGMADRPPIPPPPAPRLDAVATPVPWPVATLRGRAMDARRVIVRGSDNPIASTVLPDGTFCVDVPLPTPMAYGFEVLAQNEGGVFSEMAATADVVFDPGAAPIPGLVTCNGMDPAGCASATEICDNGRDDDCNSLVDGRDPACATCVDDVFEPNDGVDAPRADPGRYEELRMCSGNQDYYGIYARMGDTISVRLFFTHADGDIDMELLGTDRATVVATSMTMTDDESLTHVATATGEHKLHVYSPDGAMNGYALDIDVTAP